MNHRTEVLANAVRRTEQAMHVSQVDACLMPVVSPNKRDVNYWRGFRFCCPSDHGYQYSMGFDYAWSIKRQCVSPRGVGLVPGSLYNYGLIAPRYPVPTTIGRVWYEPARIGIEETDDPDWSARFWEEH